jgi:DNA-binding MarR family transcriptional regulator
LTTNADLNDAEYRALAEFRFRLRQFLRFSEQAARATGLEPQQHQLLLAIKGGDKCTPFTVGELAERLLLQHHSTVELVNRSARQGLVERQRDEHDRRRVFIRLTAAGEAVLRSLSLAHREELRAAVPALVQTLNAFLVDTGEMASDKQGGNTPTA